MKGERVRRCSVQVRSLLDSLLLHGQKARLQAGAEPGSPKWKALTDGWQKTLEDHKDVVVGWLMRWS